ncbi:MAG: histidine phosphatase family protein [Gammaproteobacteria bacterium]|nr:histidine phosphatase family protein [Gammaproteobacteria bacterium]MCF6362880.1 histidine phosphatase family protein [Gammaproteobacteria bacterium]
MKIVLLRHGRPEMEAPGKLKASELHRWINSYNSAGIHQNSQPSAGALKLAKKCKVVVCSDLPRSIESAELLGIEKIDYTDPLFREMGLPYANWPTPKAPPLFWAGIFRLLWFCGYSSNGEAFSLAKRRALKGADKLEVIAKDKGSVLHVGHGFMNRYISKALLAKGWVGPQSAGRKYWEFGVYKYHTSSCDG